MPPRTQEVLACLDDHRAALEDAVAAVPAGLRERRPAPDRWSAAEILEHLALVEASIAPLLAERIAAARAAGLGPEAETSPVLSADGLALSEVIIENPVFGPLNVYQWVAFVAGHEGRHAAQIRELAVDLPDAG